MSDRDAVLFSNEAFYRAFAGRDYSALADLWAHEAPVTCLHPGWPILVGRERVLLSWRRILANQEQPAVICRQPEVFMHGGTAIVLCYEEIQGQFLAATNVFRHEDRQWRLIHHQSGPTTESLPPADESEVPRPN